MLPSLPSLPFRAVGLFAGKDASETPQRLVAAVGVAWRNCATGKMMEGEGENLFESFTIPNGTCWKYAQYMLMYMLAVSEDVVQYVGILYDSGEYIYIYTVLIHIHV